MSEEVAALTIAQSGELNAKKHHLVAVRADAMLGRIEEIGHYGRYARIPVNIIRWDATGHKHAKRGRN